MGGFTSSNLTGLVSEANQVLVLSLNRRQNSSCKMTSEVERKKCVVVCGPKKQKQNFHCVLESEHC